MDASGIDTFISSAEVGAGDLHIGHSGGSGRLGAIRVRAGATLTLNTDSQVFPIPGQPYDLMTNFVP